MATEQNQDQEPILFVATTTNNIALSGGRWTHEHESVNLQLKTIAANNIETNKQTNKMVCGQDHRPRDSSDLKSANKRCDHIDMVPRALEHRVQTRTMVWGHISMRTHHRRS